MPRVTIWVTKDQDRQIREIAARWGASFSNTVHQLVERGIDDEAELDDAERELNTIA